MINWYAVIVSVIAITLLKLMFNWWDSWQEDTVSNILFIVGLITVVVISIMYTEIKVREINIYLIKYAKAIKTLQGPEAPKT